MTMIEQITIPEVSHSFLRVITDKGLSAELGFDELKKSWVIVDNNRIAPVRKAEISALKKLVSKSSISIAKKQRCLIPGTQITLYEKSL